MHKDYAENIVCGFARLGGRSIGIIANQPAFLAGVLDNHAQTNQHVLCVSAIAFNIPLLVFEDVPGFYLEPIKSGMELSIMAQNYYMLFLKQRCHVLQ